MQLKMEQKLGCGRKGWGEESKEDTNKWKDISHPSITRILTCQSKLSTDSTQSLPKFLSKLFTENAKIHIQL